MKARNPRSGLTLLETMVSLVIIALIATMLTSGLGLELRLLTRSTVISAEIEQALARREFRAWLENALSSAPPDDQRLIFSGEKAELAFLAVRAESSFWPGLAARVTVEATGSAFTVSGPHTENRSQMEIRFQMAPTGTELKFEYWGQPSVDTKRGWYETWPASGALPDLVRIVFINGQTDVPPLVIRPAKVSRQEEMSLSSLLPPDLPSRP